MKKYRFKGDHYNMLDDYDQLPYSGYVIGQVYCLEGESPEKHLYNNRYYIKTYPKDWEKVVEEKITLTDVEKEVLIDFLNEYFDEFCDFINNMIITTEENYNKLNGNYPSDKASTLIDKIEKI